MARGLLEGHGHFRTSYVAGEREFLERLAAEKQNPDALYVGCSDSRVVPELLTASSPGAIFVVRNVANLVPPFAHAHKSVGAAIEYAVGHLHVPHVVVCGHLGCGGVGALLDGDARGLQTHPTLRAWLSGAEPAVARARAGLGGAGGPSPAQHELLWRRAVEENVLLQLEHLATYPTVAAALDAGALSLHGWVYDLRAAGLLVYDAEVDAFVSYEEVLSRG